MGLNSKSEKRGADVSLLEDVENDERPNKRLKPIDSKGGLSAIIAEEYKTSSGPPSPVPFLSPDGRVSKPAEIFRTDLISAMKLPDTQILNPENYMTIIDSWRQEWEKGVQVPVHPEGLSQPSFSVMDTTKPPKKTTNFKLPGKLLNSEEKRKGKKPCNYDLNRMDVEWLLNLNKSRRNKGLIELDEAVLEKAISYFEDKCYENLGYAIATQEGLSIEYDESVCCDVCQSPDSEEDNEMVFCDSCDICVHQACYGIQNIPEGSWLCQPCRRGVTKPPCQLCPNPGGAMKRTKKGKNWTHVSCALWVPEIGFGSVEKMEPIIKIENIPASRWNLLCYLCREKVGACIQCTVKTCMTAFHVTCGFKHGLEMKTVLDDSAVDGVRHICYCAKHGYKNKSPPRSPEKCKKDAEDAENQRQKRLKQMETEFYKFVQVSEAAKDLMVPRELASRIHAYWTLKRKARDDIPLLPPTLEQQEKLCGKQGAASRILQVQIEELMKMRCDLERLRNLCYMVSKREKLRRELFRVREQVFWKAHEVMVDEAINIDDTNLQWIREACGKNFSCDGSLPLTQPSFGNGIEPVSSSCASTSSSAKTTTEEMRGEQSQSNEPSDCSEDELQGGYESSDSEDSPRIKTRHRLRGVSSRKSQNDVVSRIKSGSKESQQSSNVNKSSGAKDAIAALHEESEDCEPAVAEVHSPRRSLRFYKANGSREEPSDEEHKETLSKELSKETNETTVTLNDKLRGIASANEKVETVHTIGLQKPRTRGQTSESTSDDMETESQRSDDVPSSPSRALRSCKKLQQGRNSRKRSLSSRSKTMEDNDPTLHSVRETRSTRLRQSSLSQSEDEVQQETLRVPSSQTNCAVTTQLVHGKETSSENKVLKESNLRHTRGARSRTKESSNDILPSKRPRVEVKRRSKAHSKSTRIEQDHGIQSKVTDFFLRGSPKQKRVAKTPNNKFNNGYKSPRVTRSTESESSKSDEENSDNRFQVLKKSPTAKFRNDKKNAKITKSSESESSKSDEENAEGRVQRLSSLRSFSTGKDDIPQSPCPKCQIQHNRRRILSRSPERKNKELRSRNMQSPKSRSRLVPSLRCSPTRSCNNVLSQVRHTTSVV